MEQASRQMGHESTEFQRRLANFEHQHAQSAKAAFATHEAATQERLEDVSARLALGFRAAEATAFKQKDEVTAAAQRKAQLYQEEIAAVTREARHEVGELRSHVHNLTLHIAQNAGTAASSGFTDAGGLVRPDSPSRTPRGLTPLAKNARDCGMSFRR